VFKIQVNTYEKLEIFVDRWIAGTIDLLIIESGAGLGKSSLIRQKLKEIKHLSVNSHITPLMNYKQLYQHKNELIWLDDIASLFLNQINISLMKQVCESTIVKSISYNTSSNLLANVPQSFTTTSKTLISCNKIEGDNVHVKAIRDRGFHVVFVPTRKEILQKMREISLVYPLLEDREKEQVLSIIEYNSKNIKDLSLRSLMKGFQLYRYYKQKGIDWKEDFLNELGLNQKLVQMNELLVRHTSDVDRLKEWNWSKQTYYTYKKMVDFCT